MKSERQHIHPIFEAPITPLIRKKIEEHYTKNKNRRIDRAQLARSLGITKYQLNQEVMNMNLKSLEVGDEE